MLRANMKTKGPQPLLDENEWNVRGISKDVIQERKNMIVQKSKQLRSKNFPILSCDNECRNMGYNQMSNMQV
jgi:hypothetical protein